MEGITYNKANNTLLWVDIIKAEVHRIFLDDANPELNHQVVTLAERGESIGALGLTRDPDVVLVCCKKGVAMASFKKETVEYFLEYPLNAERGARLRSNDGIIDPWGNLWIGLMNDFPIATKEGVSAEGCLFRIDCKDHSVKLMLDNARISNGLAFSDDGSKFYWTDSLTFKLWQFDYDNAAQTLSNKSSLLDMRDVFPGTNSPEPDGLSFGTDGQFFHAVFGTGTVVHYDTAAAVHGKYTVPAERVTCTAIGGAKNDTLFVTTAHEKLADPDHVIDASDKQGDLGGFLFQIKPQVSLKPQHKFVWGSR